LASALPDKTSTTDFDERLVRFIAIIILTTVCLLHYFSSKLGLFLNKAIALYKVLLLISVFIAGVIASRREGSGISDWYDKHGPNGNTKRADSLAASVLILYAYQGWENANYVCPILRFGMSFSNLSLGGWRNQDTKFDA
jgi:amino acid transporter